MCITSRAGGAWEGGAWGGGLRRALFVPEPGAICEDCFPPGSAPFGQCTHTIITAVSRWFAASGICGVFEAWFWAPGGFPARHARCCLRLRALALLGGTSFWHVLLGCIAVVLHNGCSADASCRLLQAPCTGLCSCSAWMQGIFLAAAGGGLLRLRPGWIERVFVCCGTYAVSPVFVRRDGVQGPRARAVCRCWERSLLTVPSTWENTPKTPLFLHSSTVFWHSLAGRAMRYARVAALRNGMRHCQPATALVLRTAGRLRSALCALLTKSSVGDLWCMLPQWRHIHNHCTLTVRGAARLVLRLGNGPS